MSLCFLLDSNVIDLSEKRPACIAQAGPELWSREEIPAMKTSQILEFPVSPVGQRVEDLVGFIVADDSLFLGIPFNSASDLM